jgi:hypothetical protein
MKLAEQKSKAATTPVLNLQYRSNTAVILSNFPKSALSIYKNLGISPCLSPTGAVSLRQNYRSQTGLGNVAHVSRLLEALAAGHMVGAMMLP